MANLLTVGIRATTGGLATGLRKARGMVNSWTSGIAGQIAGAFAMGAVINSVKGVLQKAEDLDDIATRFGISAQAFQQAANVADVSGSSLNSVEKALMQLTGRSALAVQGNKLYMESFKALGVSMQDLRTDDPMTLFFKIADGVGSIKNETEQAAHVMQVMGSKQINLITTLRKGSKAIKEQGDAMGTWDQDTTKSLANANVAMRNFGRTMTIGLGNAVKWIMDTTQKATIGVIWYGKMLASFWSMMFGIFKAIGKAIWDQVKAIGSLGKALGQLVMGDFSGASKSLDDFVTKSKNAYSSIFKSARKEMIAFGKDFSLNTDVAASMFTKVGKTPGGEETESGTMVDSEGLEQAVKLKEKIAKMEEENRLKALTQEERLAELRKEAKELETSIHKEGLEGLKNRERQLLVEREIAAIKEEQLAAEKTLGDEQEAARKKMAKDAADYRAQVKEKEKRDAKDKVSDLQSAIGAYAGKSGDSITRIGGGRIGKGNFSGNVLANLLKQQTQATKHLANIENGMKDSGLTMKP